MHGKYTWKFVVVSVVKIVTLLLRAVLCRTRHQMIFSGLCLTVCISTVLRCVFHVKNYAEAEND